MAVVKYTLNTWDWDFVLLRRVLSPNIFIAILAKKTMFVAGVELWKYGGMLFVGPLAIGFGTIEPETELTGGKDE